jgi:preprotein translocase subunit SecD
MKITTLSLILVLLASACSHRSERATSPVTPNIAIDSSKPHFELVVSDLAAPAVISTNGVGSGHDTIVISFQLSADKAAEFAKFTQEHLRQQTQLICDSKVVAEPFVASPIAGGRVQVAFSSLEQARVIEELLNKKR